jgi:hypothetical protein
MVNERGTESKFTPDSREKIDDPNRLTAEMYREKWMRKAFQWVAYELEDHNGEGLLVTDLLQKWAALMKADIGRHDTQPVEEIQAQEQLIEQILGY